MVGGIDHAKLSGSYALQGSLGMEGAAAIGMPRQVAREESKESP